MPRFVWPLVLAFCIATAPASARFGFEEEGHFSGNEFLNTLHSDSHRLVYILGLVDGLLMTFGEGQRKVGENIALALCLMANDRAEVTSVFEQYLRQHPELQLKPANHTFATFAREVVCPE